MFLFMQEPLIANKTVHDDDDQKIGYRKDNLSSIIHRNKLIQLIKEDKAWPYLN